MKKLETMPWCCTDEKLRRAPACNFTVPILHTSLKQHILKNKCLLYKTKTMCTNTTSFITLSNIIQTKVYNSHIKKKLHFSICSFDLDNVEHCFDQVKSSNPIFSRIGIWFFWEALVPHLKIEQNGFLKSYIIWGSYQKSLPWWFSECFNSFAFSTICSSSMFSSLIVGNCISLHQKHLFSPYDMKRGNMKWAWLWETWLSQFKKQPTYSHIFFHSNTFLSLAWF